MPNLSQRYIAALAELSQFACVQGDKDTLTHVLSGVHVAPESEDDKADSAALLHLNFGDGTAIEVSASHYLELMLAEDAAHQMHAAGEGSGEIHRRAKEKLARLTNQHCLTA